VITATPLSGTPHYLGKLLVERRAKLSDIAIPAILAGVAFLFGMLVVVGGIYETLQAGVINEKDSEGFGIGIIALLASFSMWGYCGLSLYTVLRCYELGIVKTTPLGTRELRFDELESLTFSKKMQRHNTGAELGYSYRMEFQPLSASGRKNIEMTIHRYGKEDQTEFEAIRDHVADIVAERLGAELQRTGAVAWTPFMRITRDGLECGEKQRWQLVSWEDLRLVVEGGDFLEVYHKSRPGMVISVGQICENFYPGLLVATEKLAESREEQKS
jgi:hypothetical protein